MDPQPPEQPKSQEQEKPIVIPKETARALGRGLRQFFPKTILENMRQNITELKEICVEKAEWIDIMHSSINQLIDFLDSLEKSKEVELVRGESAWEFKFSKELAAEEKPQPGTIIVDAETAFKLYDALQDKLGNSLSPVKGYAELIEDRENIPDNVLKKSRSIKEISKGMGYNFLFIYAGGQEMMKLLTDEKGLTTISFIPPRGQPSRKVSPSF